MISNLILLKSEYETDPLGRGYAGMDDAALLADLNAPVYPQKRSVPNRDIKVFSLNEGILSKITREAKKAEDGISTLTEPTQDVCLYFVSLFNDPEGSQDFTYIPPGDVIPAIESRLDLLVTAGILDEATKSQKTKCLQLADIESLQILAPVILSRVEVLYGRGIKAHPGDIDFLRPA